MKGRAIVYFVLLFCASSAYASSPCQEDSITVQRSQILALQTRLQRLSQLNQLSLTDWQNQQAKLAQLEQKCQSLEKTLNQQYLDSRKQSELLQSVNRSFKTHSQQTNDKLRKEKQQKTIWAVIAGVLACVCIAK